MSHAALAAPTASKENLVGRLFDWLGGVVVSVAEGIRDSLVGVWQSLATAGSGSRAFFEKLSGSLILVGMKVWSALQTTLFLERPGRPLTAKEIETLKGVFQEGIDWERVRIKEGFAGLFSLSDRPMTIGNTIYTKGGALSSEVLVHELVHVRQFQHDGADYLFRSVFSQLVHGKDKTYDYAAPIAKGEHWAELNPEQQAELVQDAYEKGSLRRAEDPSKLQFVGPDGKDYSGHLQEGMTRLRAE